MSAITRAEGFGLEVEDREGEHEVDDRNVGRLGHADDVITADRVARDARLPDPASILPGDRLDAPRSAPALEDEETMDIGECEEEEEEDTLMDDAQMELPNFDEDGELLLDQLQASSANYDNDANYDLLCPPKKSVKKHKNLDKLDHDKLLQAIERQVEEDDDLDLLYGDEDGSESYKLQKY